MQAQPVLGGLDWFHHCEGTFILMQVQESDIVSWSAENEMGAAYIKWFLNEEIRRMIASA